MSGSASITLPKRVLAWMRTGFVPKNTGALEWLGMRICFAALVLWTLYDPHPFDYPGQPTPKGIARWIDLTWLHNDHMFEITFGVSALLCVLYAAGFALRLVLPLLAAMHVVVWTYNDSQGYTHHGLQLVSMVLLVQTLVVWIKGSASREDLRAWLWYYSRGMVLFSYVASALTKTIETRGLWIFRSRYLTIELVKTWRLQYLEAFDPQFSGDPPMAFWLNDHPFVAQCVFGVGYFLELFAFLGLRDRVSSAVVGFLLVTMHLGISWLMQLDFANHQWLALIFLVNPIGWLILLTTKKQNSSRLATV
jgi:hypothetical protein